MPAKRSRPARGKIPPPKRTRIGDYGLKVAPSEQHLPQNATNSNAFNGPTLGGMRRPLHQTPVQAGDADAGEFSSIAQGQTFVLSHFLDDTRRRCGPCANLSFCRPSQDQLAKRLGHRLGILSNIESIECSLCTFFRELRQLRQSIGVDFAKEIGRPYVLKAHSASRMFNVKGLPAHSVVFSVSPPNERVDFHFYGRSFGRFFSNTLDSPIRQPSSSVDYDSVLKWLAFCTSYHSKRCRARQPARLPCFQVIDCHTHTVVPWDYDNAGQVYVTLSYVWGKGEDCSSGLNGGLPNILPRVIEDSICVATRLGFRYLWVDRYCIPQSDIAAKTVQIRNMNTIYEHSELTIVAAAGDDPSHGLPGVRGNSRRPYPSVTVQDTMLVPLLSNTVHEIKTSPWNGRGWTYQEALLSRRCLIFTDSQAYFQCRGMHCQESISISLDGLHTLNKQRFRADSIRMPDTFASSGPGLERWSFQGNVAVFALRSLTYQADTLNAFRGILQAFRQPTQTKVKPVDNYYGIPLFSSELGDTDVLVYGLDWIIDDNPNDVVMGRNQMPDRTQIASAVRRPQFPSWTWLGWKISTPLMLDFCCYPLSILLSPTRTLTLSPSDTDLTGLPRFASCVAIFVQRSDGYLLSWEESSNTILNMYLEHPAAPRLGIVGWTLDLDIPLGEIEQPGSISDKVKFTDFYIDQRAFALAYLTAYHHGFPVRKRNGVVRLTLMLLSRWSIPHFLTQIYAKHSMTAMVIVKCNDAANDGTYERMGLVHLHFYRDPHPQIWNDESNSPGPGFTMKHSKEIVWLK